MVWLLFAILAPLFWAVSNLIDGHLIYKRIRTPVALFATTGLFGGLTAFVSIVYGNFTWPGWSVASLGVAAGVIGLLAYYPYFRALESAHPASAVLMWNLSPALVAVLAFGILGERLAVRDYAAIALLFASATAASWPRQSHTPKAGHAVPWMGLASLLLAVEAVLQKRLFAVASFTAGMTIMSIASFAAGIVALLAAPSARRELRAGAGRWTVARLIAANELLNLAAVVCVSLAVSLASVSLVKAIGGFQPVLVVLLDRVIAARRPGLTAPHAPGGPHLGPCIVAAALAIAGLALIGWGG